MSKTRSKQPTVTKIPRLDGPSSSKSTGASSSTSYPGSITVEEITLARPTDLPRAPGTKTLIDIIEERRPQNPDGTPVSARKAKKRKKEQKDTPQGEESGSEADEEETEEIQVVGPFAQSIFHAVPMATLLTALDIVVHHQYRQDLHFTPILLRTLKSFPIMVMLLYYFHPRRLHPLTQAFFFILSIMCGTWLVHAVNRYGYYAVMKRAPPVGTLWIWAAVEMELGVLLVSCAVVGGYVYWGGYSIV